jgi:prepilin-type N-terminal cleavage/methylation domain-containing protein
MTQTCCNRARIRRGSPRACLRLCAERANFQWPPATGGAPGFTLLEIAVVIFIMGLIMTLAVPYLGGFRGAQLKSEARRLAGRANYLYDQSATEKVIYKMTFDLDHNEYYVTRLDPFGPLPKFIPYRGPWGFEVVMPAGLRLRDVSVEGIGAAKVGAISCRFYPEGYVDATVIHLGTASGQIMTLSFNPLTGNVGIVSGDVPPVTALAMTQ